MLNNDIKSSCHTGNLDKGILKQNAYRYNLIAFIANELPNWKADPEREILRSEDDITGSLCLFLQDKVRFKEGMDNIYFGTEFSDERYKNRNIDISYKIFLQ